jgi:hypothetical protein
MVYGLSDLVESRSIKCSKKLTTQTAFLV